MTYLIKLLAIFIFFFKINLYANELLNNSILFKIEDTAYTNIDLERRVKYISVTNNLNKSLFSNDEINEILEDYIASLIFYKYYNNTNKKLKNLNEEIKLIYKNNIENKSKYNEEEIKNFKYNIKIDLIRKKIIEEKINFRKNELLQEANTLDLLYNYNLQYLIISEKLIDNSIIKEIKNREDFNTLTKNIIDKNINFFYKEQDINNNTQISNNIKKMITENLIIYNFTKNGYINIYSLDKNFESYEGVFVKLINFKTSNILSNEDLNCNKIEKNENIQSTIYKEYEYSKLNKTIKNSLKSINDYIIFNENNVYNYIFLCDLRFDENLLRSINFDKNVNSLVNKIQNNFLKKYKNEYKFKKIK